MKFCLILVATVAFGQTYNVVDTAPFPVGNPPIAATCTLQIAAPQITSGSSTYWAVPYPYQVNGSISLWLQPASVVYKITGQCSYQQPSQSTKISQCWLVPNTCTGVAPCTVAQIVSSCPGTTPPSGSGYLTDPGNNGLVARVAQGVTAARVLQAGTNITITNPDGVSGNPVINSSGGGGGVSSVFGRTGAVTATNGDYTVGQVTGAAPLASPTFTGTPAAPTPATADDSTDIATTAYVQAQGYGTGTVTGTGSATYLPVWTGASSLGVSAASDSGGTLSYAGNFAATGTITAGGPSGSAGAVELPQGTAPSYPANSFTLFSPTSISTAYGWSLPAAAGTGFVLGTNTSNTVALTQVGSTGTGNVVRATSPTLVTPNIGAATGTSVALTADSVINANAASLPGPQTGTLLQLGQADGTGTRLELDGFAAPGYISTVREDGTAASPTTLQAGDEIGGHNAFGYNSSAIVGPRASIRLYANQNWTTGANGTYADVATTPNGATSQAEVIRFENDGGVTVPSTVTGGDKGAGTINAAGMYVNGTAVSTTSGTVTSVTCGTGLTGGTITTTGTCAVGGSAGEILAGSTPALTATPSLGTDNSTAGTLQLANGSANAHTIWGSGATTTNTILGFATAPTTGHIVTVTVSGTTSTLTDGGAVPAGTVTSVATSSPITGGTITSSGTIACATCVTSAASLTSSSLMTGAGSQASQTGVAAIQTAAGAASAPALLLNGSAYTGGTGTTTWPMLLVQPSGTTTSAWSTSGTMIGVNAVNGFTGNLMDIQNNGSSQFSVGSSGVVSAATEFSAAEIKSPLIRGSGASSPYLQLRNDSSGAVTGAGTIVEVTPGAYSNSSGVANPFAIVQTYNQTSTAAATDLLINRTETVVGTGPQLLADAQVGSVSKFNIDHTGAIGVPLNLTGPYQPEAAPTAGTPTSGGSCTAGTHTWEVTFLDIAGETIPSAASAVKTCVTTSGQTVPLSAIPLGPVGTTGRNIYATKTGNTGSYYLIATSPVIADNTTTTYSFTLADTSFTVTTAPASSTTAQGLIQVAGTNVAYATSAGKVELAGTNPGSLLTVNGGDVYVTTSANGLILLDTVLATCARIQLTSGALVATTVTCPTF